MTGYYVYILQSESEPSRHYTGSTSNLRARVRAHNQGKNNHTRKFRPWRIKTALFFTEEDRAKDFELCLKSGAGRAFAKKRL